VSWGGYESLALTQKLQALGMPAPVWYVRLFIGLEDPGELIEDIEQALHASELA
jgi:cystathionine beta-lyase/cystathionine gamma-synthase